MAKIPAYTKIGAAVYYDIGDLDRLMAAHRRRSTSDIIERSPAPGRGPVPAPPSQDTRLPHLPTTEPA